MIDDHFLWTESEVHNAIAALARASRLPYQKHPIPSIDSIGSEGPTTIRWLERSAQAMGLEAHCTATRYSQVSSLIESCAPALLRIQLGGRTGWLVVVACRRGQVIALCPNHSQGSIPARAVVESLCSPLRQEVAPKVKELLQAVELPTHRLLKAEQALLGELLSKRPIEACWLLRSPGRLEVPWLPRIGLILAANLLHQAFTVASWSALGWIAFTDQVDLGWLVAWMFLVFCTVPMRWVSNAAIGTLAIDLGATFRQRLLRGTLRMEHDSLRSTGIGGFIGKALEVEAFEQSVMRGGFQVALSMIDLVLAMVILGLLAGQWWLVGWLLSVVLLAWMLMVRQVTWHSLWTQERLSLTCNLVERFVGYRTTLAQELPSMTLQRSDRSLDCYVCTSEKLDRGARILIVLPARFWLLGALALLAYQLVYGSVSPTILAMTIGGILMAKQSLLQLANGLERLVVLRSSWQQLKEFFTATGHVEDVGDAAILSMGRSSAAKPIEDQLFSCEETPEPVARPVLLECRELHYSHQGGNKQVLAGVNLTIRAGDHFLLLGASGGGKSTLAALLAGSRRPSSGVRLLEGLDPSTWGEEWRRRVGLAPQFHDNHVLLGTLLFNLMLGRHWPPTQEDVTEADQVCHELELGPLISRMPGGLMQNVGETGWQLSHGEKSRLYLARALLQKSDVTIFDESLAALDPMTLKTILPKILQRCPALMLIAHP